MDLRREGGRRITSWRCKVKFEMPSRHQSEDAREGVQDGGWTRRGDGIQSIVDGLVLISGG